MTTPDKTRSTSTIALVTIMGAFVLQLAILLLGITRDFPPVPPWVTAVLMAITGYLFGDQVANGKLGGKGK